MRNRAQYGDPEHSRAEALLGLLPGPARQTHRRAESNGCSSTWPSTRAEPRKESNGGRTSPTERIDTDDDRSFGGDAA